MDKATIKNAIDRHYEGAATVAEIAGVTGASASQIRATLTVLERKGEAAQLGVGSKGGRCWTVY